MHGQATKIIQRWKDVDIKHPEIVETSKQKPKPSQNQSAKHEVFHS